MLGGAPRRALARRGAVVAPAGKSRRAGARSSSVPDAPRPPPLAPARPPPLPVAAFIDLDNVTPTTHRRPDARDFVRPLVEFGRRVNRPDADVAPSVGSTQLLSKLRLCLAAFGNLSTRTWRHQEEQERDLSQQEYILWTGLDEQGNVGVAQTGYDKDGLLRCGICGSKMKLTKKDRKSKRTLEDKLRSHMKLHSREQGKRLQKMKHHKGRARMMESREFERMKKYEAAMVGLKRGKLALSKKGKVQAKSRNDLFQVLREVGVRVKAEDDVDKALIEAAQRWMRRVAMEDAAGGDGDGDGDGGSVDGRGVVLVYSKDGDFAPLLERAGARGFVTVTATDEERQTPKLVASSDIVIGALRHWDAVGESRSPSVGAPDSADDTDEDSVVRDVPAAPVADLLSHSAASSHDSAIRAVPVTERGVAFMRERDGAPRGDAVGRVQWTLGLKGTASDRETLVESAQRQLSLIKHMKLRNLAREETGGADDESHDVSTTLEKVKGNRHELDR